LGLFKLTVLPPRPSPFLRMAVPEAAIETSYLSIGLTSVKSFVLHVVLGEVTEGGVGNWWKVLVVVWFPLGA